MPETITIPTKSILSTLRDPTQTTTLRSAFVTEMNKRFRHLRGLIRMAIVAEDLFGLNDPVTITILQTPGRRRFAFPRSADKVSAFMDWLIRQIEADILEVTILQQIGSGVESAWTNVFINDSYRRGVTRARAQLVRGGFDVPPLSETGGINAAMNTPFHLDRIGLLFTRTFNELKGITDAMAQQISRVLAQGLVDGLSPATLARQLNAVIGSGLGLTDTLGRFIPAERRARILARTEIIRAHSEATLQEFRNWGVVGVTVDVEFITAGDNRVCPQCADLEGSVFPIEKASGIIPVHAQCFIDSQVPVYTSKGWKGIGKIKIGDQVLSHKGKFRKVYALPRQIKQSPEVVKFAFPNMDSGNALTMTLNHPVLVSENGTKIWKDAGDCKKGDKLLLFAHECHRCTELIPYWRKYCSATCCSLDTTDKQWSNPEHRKIVSDKNRKSMLLQYKSGERDRFEITKKANEKVRQLIADGSTLFADNLAKGKHLAHTPEIDKATSERMKNKNPMHDPIIAKKAHDNAEKFYRQNPERRLNTIMAQFRKSDKMTSIERKVADLLDKMKVDYIFQYPILRYNVDFAIPSLKIVIECDGEYWHRNTKEKDKIRQHKIEQEGWFVLRFTDTKINKELEQVGNELERVLMNHNDKYEFMEYPIQAIEKWKVKKPRTLYNLSVEKDESYIAKGIVVHNCRCAWIPVPPTRSRR